MLQCNTTRKGLAARVPGVFRAETQAQSIAMALEPSLHLIRTYARVRESSLIFVRAFLPE